MSPRFFMEDMGWGELEIHCIEQIIVLPRLIFGVDIQRKLAGRMTQNVLNSFDIHAGGYHPGGAGLPQGVQVHPNRVNPSLLDIST